MQDVCLIRKTDRIAIDWCRKARATFVLSCPVWVDRSSLRRGYGGFHKGTPISYKGELGGPLGSQLVKAENVGKMNKTT